MELQSTNLLQGIPSTEALLCQDQELLASPNSTSQSESIDHQELVGGAISANMDASKTETSKPALSIPQIKSGMLNITHESESVFRHLKEFDVPLPMISQVRNLYIESLRENRDNLRSIKRKTPISSNHLSNIDIMLDNLRRICDYSSLKASDQSTQRKDLRIYEARYAENISTKFIFVIELLNLMKMYEKHIVIIIREELMNIFEEILKRQEFVYHRADHPEIVNKSTQTINLKTTLLPTLRGIKIDQPADLIIAFDSSYHQFESSREFETIAATINSSTILIRLIIYHSIEHIERLFDFTTNSIHAKFKLIELLFDLAPSAGALPREYPGPPDSARLISEYILLRKTDTPWPLPPIVGRKNNAESIGDVYNQDILSLPEDTPEMPSTVTSTCPTLVKRLPDSNLIENFKSLKRQKLEISLELACPKLQIGQSSSTNLEGNYPPLWKNEIYVADDNIAYNVANSEANMQEKEYILLLHQKLNSLEIQLRKNEARKTELYQENRDMELRYLDIENSLRKIQPKYQEALNDRGLFEHERKLAQRREQITQQKLENKEAILAKAQNENSIIRKELEAAHEALTSSNIPEVAELEKMRLEVSNLKVENENLKRQKKMKESDYDYIQTNYQTASNSAASLARQVSSQKSEIENLRIKACDNSIKIHEIHRDNVISELQRSIRGLKAEKLELEKQIERFSGRPNTRGSSVPRSPRLSAYMPSPRPTSRVIGSYNTFNTTVGSKSRGSSPVAMSESSSISRVVPASNADDNILKNPYQLQQQNRITEKTNLKRFGSHLQ